jgi:hypothetical protein
MMFLSCRCQKPPFHYLDFRQEALGTDAQGADVSIDVCKRCNSVWLVYLIEEPHYTGSSRWWRTQISRNVRRDLRIENARRTIEASRWCFVCGSFYGGEVRKVSSVVVT